MAASIAAWAPPSPSSGSVATLNSRISALWRAITAASIRPCASFWSASACRIASLASLMSSRARFARTIAFCARSCASLRSPANIEICRPALRTDRLALCITAAWLPVRSAKLELPGPAQALISVGVLAICCAWCQLDADALELAPGAEQGVGVALGDRDPLDALARLRAHVRIWPSSVSR